MLRKSYTKHELKQLWMRDIRINNSNDTVSRRRTCMYDSHIYCREYKELKDQIVDIVNGETEEQE